MMYPEDTRQNSDGLGGKQKKKKPWQSWCLFFFRSTFEASAFVSHHGKKYMTVYWQSHHHKQDAFLGASRWNCCYLDIHSLNKMATLVAVKIEEAIQQFCSAEKGSLVLLEIIFCCSPTDSLTFGLLSLVCSHPLWSKTPQRLVSPS